MHGYQSIIGITQLKDTSFFRTASTFQAGLQPERMLTDLSHKRDMLIVKLMRIRIKSKHCAEIQANIRYGFYDIPTDVTLMQIRWDLLFIFMKRCRDGASFNQWKNNECAIGIENLDIEMSIAPSEVCIQLRTLSSLHPMFR
jgi:hypothetical protein